MADEMSGPRAEIQTLVGDEWMRPHNLYRWYCHDCKERGDGDVDGVVAKRGLAQHLEERHQ